MQTEKPYNLFVLVGESHLFGVKGDAIAYPPDPEGLDADIPFYSVEFGSGAPAAWTRLGSQPGLFPDGHFGPEISLARALRRGGWNPAIFKYSHPYSSVAEDWLLPGEGGLYDLMRIELEKAIGDFSAKGHTVILRGLVWLQGESDASDPEMAAAYESSLATILAHFRRRYGSDDMLTVLSADMHHPHTLQNPAVITAQKRLTEAPGTAFVSIAGLDKKDGHNLSGGGLWQLGKRLAETFALLNAAAKPP